MTQFITQDDIATSRLDKPIRFGPIGEQVYLRTYSRTKRDGTLEDWYDTCARVVNGNCNYVPETMIEKGEAQKLLDLFLGMECIPAGRHLWATNIGNNTGFLNNCFSADFTDNFIEHFEFTFTRLMEGGGVGSNYSNRFVNSRGGTPSEEGKPWSPKAPKHIHFVCNPRHDDYHSDVQLSLYEEGAFPGAYWKEFRKDKDHPAGLEAEVDHQTKDANGNDTAPYIKFSTLMSDRYVYDWDPGASNGQGPIFLKVEDSREGWAKVLSKILESYVADDTERDIVVDVSNLRPYGANLRGFGGKASGPGAFLLLLRRVEALLNSKVDQNLTGLDCMLIDHYIAMAVVSGGSRRSARMAMKYWQDKDIFEFINCKRVEKGKVPNHWTTNISVVIDNKFLKALKRKDPHAINVYEAIAEGMLLNGEPGVINASKCLEGEPAGAVFFCTNPCGEIAFIRYPDMYCFDVCCLGHVNLSRVKNPEEAFRLMTRFLIRATFAPVSDPKQRANVERNRRIGVGFFGYHNWLAKNKVKYSDAPNNEDVKKFMKRMKEVVDRAAQHYAHQLRIPMPVKRTTLAPTGSIANLPGDVSSAQSSFAKFLIRRVRYSNTDAQLEIKRQEGYKIESDLYAANTSVVEFVSIDPIYDEVYEMCKAAWIQKGCTTQQAAERAAAEANSIIEDQSDIDMEDVLATQKMLQTEYVDNAISITINVNPEKYKPSDVCAVLRHYLPDLKGITMFPEMAFPQSPLERITYEQLEQLGKGGYPIERGQAEQACANGACPIK